MKSASSPHLWLERYLILLEWTLRVFWAKLLLPCTFSHLLLSLVIFCYPTSIFLLSPLLWFFKCYPLLQTSCCCCSSLSFCFLLYWTDMLFPCAVPGFIALANIVAHTTLYHTIPLYLYPICTICTWTPLPTYLLHRWSIYQFLDARIKYLVTFSLNSHRSTQVSIVHRLYFREIGKLGKRDPDAAWHDHTARRVRGNGHPLIWIRIIRSFFMYLLLDSLSLSALSSNPANRITSSPNTGSLSWQICASFSELVFHISNVFVTDVDIFEASCILSICKCHHPPKLYYWPSDTLFLN